MQSVILCPLRSSHEKRLQQTVCRRRLCLHVKAADLGVEMAKQRGMPLPPDSGNASLCCYTHVSPNLVLFTGSTRRSSSRRERLGA